MAAMIILASARSGLSAIAAIILIAGAVPPAHAQARPSSSSAQATDTSYFHKYHKLQTIYLYVKGRAGGTIHPGRPMAREDSTSAT
jgi:hypothetical protein